MSFPNAVPGVTCRKCGGRIEERVINQMKKFCEKHQREYKPPALCEECWWLSLNKLMGGEEDDEEDNKGG